MPARAPVPVSLRRALDAHSIFAEDPCDSTICLGSFWPNSRTSFESGIVKGFKECHPAADYQPHISALCGFYTELVLRAVEGKKFDWVARVLSSSEKEPDSSRPQSLLTDMLCSRSGARSAAHLFFKTESRPSMRNVKRLCGPDALDARISYVLQDLFIRPHNLGGTVLLIDDIYNLGASCRVYARALKDFAGANAVYAMNLAATRFNRGKDGHGLLRLDASELENTPGLQKVWVDSGGTYHLNPDCSAIDSPAACAMKFIAERKMGPCRACIAQTKPARKWWMFWT